MNIETIRSYCLEKNHVEESLPFDEHTLVFKVMGKIFALVALDECPLAINLKCNPDYAIELRERYPAIQPGYHMNKKHWNTLSLDGSLPNILVHELIDCSYDLVWRSLSKRLKG